MLGCDQKKFIETFKSGKGCKSISKAMGSREPQWEPLSPNRENLEQLWIFPEVAGLLKFLQKHIDDSSRMSQKNQTNI